MFFVNGRADGRWTVVLAFLKRFWLAGKSTLLIGGKYSDVWRHRKK